MPSRIMSSSAAAAAAAAETEAKAEAAAAAAGAAAATTTYYSLTMAQVCMYKEEFNYVTERGAHRPAGRQLTAAVGEGPGGGRGVGRRPASIGN